MSKILNNTTTSATTITDTGVTIPASSAYTIQTQDYPLFAASSDIVTLIGAGTITVSDGSFVLTKAAGIALIQGNFRQTDFISDLKVNNRLKVDVSGLSSDNIVEGAANQFFTVERAQDAVGGALVDSTSVDFTYDDPNNTITAVVLPAGVNHNLLQNYVANQHVDHSTVSISAGTGLTGGGAITTSQTISMPSVGTPGTYGSASSVPVITTDTQGRTSAVTSTPILVSEAQVTNLVTDLAAKQPLNANLTSLAANTTAGLLTETATGTITARTLTPGTGLTVTNGNGVAGNPTVAITNTGVVAATYGTQVAVPQITVNAQGQITNMSTVTITNPVADHWNGTTQYNNYQLRDYTNIGTTDANGRVTVNLTTTGLAGGPALFSSILFADAIAVDNSGNALQVPLPSLQSVTATQVIFRFVDGTSTGVLIGGTITSLQYTGAGYTVYISIRGIKA